MIRVFIILLILGSFAVSSPSSFAASRDVGEGYAKISFKELTQTLVLLGGLDITNPKVADEYARLVYCDLYSKNFENDVFWNKIRQQIITRAQEKKEYFRVLYETYGIFKLGRYDFEHQFFPLTPETAMKNVGSMVLLTAKEFEPYCGDKKIAFDFSPNINLILNHSFTLDKMAMPMDKVEWLLAQMAEEKNVDRQLYGRIRFRIIDTPGAVISNHRVIRVELLGEVTYIDFFLDAEMTKPIGGIQMAK